jgi:rare lipoprotein A
MPLLRYIGPTVLVLTVGVGASTAGEQGHRHSRLRGVQTGLASFYGPGFNGEKTASGERFDQRKLVAAHRTLPLGSVVRVTNLENDRSVVLRVIDRGPYGRNHRKGCVIDVSKAAAQRLGFVRGGITHVTVRVLRRGEHNRIAASR